MRHAEPLRAGIYRFGSARDRSSNTTDPSRGVKSRQRSVHFRFAVSGSGLRGVRTGFCNAGNRLAVPVAVPDNARDR